MPRRIQACLAFLLGLKTCQIEKEVQIWPDQITFFGPGFEHLVWVSDWSPSKLSSCVNTTLMHSVQWNRISHSSSHPKGGKSLSEQMCCELNCEHPVTRCSIHTAELKHSLFLQSNSGQGFREPSHAGEICKRPHRDSIKSDRNGSARMSQHLESEFIGAACRKWTEKRRQEAAAE